MYDFWQSFWQDFAAILLVCLAASYLAWRVRPFRSRAGMVGCAGGCSGCSSAEDAGNPTAALPFARSESDVIPIDRLALKNPTIGTPIR